MWMENYHFSKISMSKTQRFQCQTRSLWRGLTEKLHCKYFSCNISGFYACPIISCSIVVLITTPGCTQLLDVMNLLAVHCLHQLQLIGVNSYQLYRIRYVFVVIIL